MAEGRGKGKGFHQAMIPVARLIYYLSEEDSDGHLLYQPCA